MTAEERLIEEVAFRLWREEAERAAPKIARYRTLEAFRNETRLEDYRAWMRSAHAIIPIVAQHCAEVARSRFQSGDLHAAGCTIATALEKIGQSDGC